MKFSFQPLAQTQQKPVKKHHQDGKMGIPPPETHEFCFYKGGSFYPNDLLPRRIFRNKLNLDEHQLPAEAAPSGLYFFPFFGS